MDYLSDQIITRSWLSDYQKYKNLLKELISLKTVKGKKYMR